MYELFCYLTLNRAGTRTGRITWLYFGLLAFLLIANELLVNILHVMPLSISEPVFMWVGLLSPLILLFNRLDYSGPTRAEAQEAARVLAVAKEAREEVTLSYRLGKWVGQWVRRHCELVKVVNILGKRLGGLSLGVWLGVFLLVIIGATILDYHRSQSTNGAPAYLSAQLPDNSTRVAPGGVVLIVPAINGFRFPAEQERGVYALLAPVILPNSHLLAALLSDADFRLFASGHNPELNDYFILQIPRSIEDRAVTLSEFQSLRRGIREQQESAQIRVSPIVMRQLAEVSKQASDRAGVETTITITEPVSLGVFEDTERSIGVTILSKVRAETHAAQTEDLMLSASATTVVRGKLLYLNSACTFHSMIDVSRCNSQVKTWLFALHAANP